MDDTQQSRASDAATTRKRRSSILKSQRAPRTPFSELEFNVATPTDASKSRRVSFSRRTGVAEFITNEATTTWKNFYEEHNKSMESSGNESEANPSRQPVGHLGNRLFDQQFQEEEGVDFIGTLNPSSHSFTQVAPIETPQNNFELSALTDHQSKLFGNDFTVPIMGETSGRIDVNFSTLHKIGDDKDDLDEIQRDIERVSNNVVCHGPARDRQNVSEYFEVDLNMTHVPMHNDQSDMSITDTVHSPQVQDVSKSCSIDKKVNINNDWVADKENIVVNPYVAPRESVNFALNEEPDKVLVFDGKRLTIQSENSDKNYRQTLLPNISETPQRKTIVLNVNDDLPNFVDNPQISKIEISGMVGITESSQSSASSDVSTTTSLDRDEVPSKRLTILDNGNISVPQVVPSNIITESDRRKSVVYGDGDISITQALPAQILTNRRRTVTYETDTGNISITQAVPSNIIVNNVDRRQTVVFDDEFGNLSITQAIPTNILPDTKRRTVVYDNKDGNISITRAGPAIPVQEKRHTILFEDANISVTQMLPTKVIPRPERKRRTIHYDDDDGNISVTQMVPSNLILPEHIDKTVYDGGNISQTLPVNVLNDNSLRKVYENNTVDVSITQAVPAKIIQGYTENEAPTKESMKEIDQVSEHKTDTDADNISLTQSLPKYMYIEKDDEKRKTIVLGEDNGNISSTQSFPLNVLLDKLDSASEQGSYRNLDGSHISISPKLIPMTEYVDVIQSSSQETFVFKEQDAEMSATELVDTNLDEEKSKKNIFGNTGNISMSKPIPADIVTVQNLKSDVKQSNISVQDTNQDIFVYQAVTTHSSLKLPQTRTDQSDLKNENPALASKVDDIPSGAAEDIESKQSAESVKQVCNTDRRSFIKDVVLIDDVKSETTKPSVTSIYLDDADDKNLNSKDSDLEKDKKSVLDGLLDMSVASADGIEDKGLMVIVSPKPSLVNAMNAPDRSSESLFYVTKDSDEESQTEPKVAIVTEETLAIEFKEEHDIPKLKEELLEFEEVSEDKKSLPRNRYYEKVLSSDLVITESSENVEKSKGNKSFHDNTRELLEMITHLTEKTVNENVEESAPVAVPAIGNKSEAVEPRRLSFAPNRRSIVVSRENLLSDISMAQAALQKSHFEMNDSDATEDTKDSTTEHSLHKQSVRKSNEVVKTLHFEDESISESSIKSDAKMTPLKKTAFGETSYMRESKVNVIPTFLKDVSDGMKELMLDLVKPMADVMPFDAPGVDKSMYKKSTSTCSTQIQANLVTSSQVDIETEMYSNVESCYSMPMKGQMKIVSNPSEKSFEVEMESPFNRSRMESRSPIPQIIPGNLLVFDHNNPLNNIHLGPSDYSCAHKYNPENSDDKISDQISSDKVIVDRDYEIERVSMQYNVGRLSHAMEGDACSDNAFPITLSNTSKVMSIDQSIDAKVTEVKDIEVNTLIAMKGTKELLQASSSLTLVDDAVSNGNFETDIETKSPSLGTDKADRRVSISPMRVIYQIDEQFPEKLVEEKSPNLKGTKRNYSPTSRKKHKHITDVDITPKPNIKMQRRSNSPNIFKKVLDMNHASEHTLKLLADGHDITAMDIDSEEMKPQKSPKKPKSKKSNTYTVQHVFTDVSKDIEGKADEPLKSDCSSVDPKSQSDIVGYISPDVMSSVASGYKINAMKDVYSGTTTESEVTPRRDASRIDWHPELINELSSKNLVTECESGVNVVAKIDMLPFMGSHECEWESSSVDTWTFRLLHARLRLTVRLAHRHDNAARTRVRADTCVHDLSVEIARHDKKNPVVTLCVRFACEAMRYMCATVSRRGARAGDVPALLRRAAAVARVALRWGRAMLDARVQLAYSIDSDGRLALKVANIPLRSVWEVTMRVELVVEDARETPWPRAGGVRVSRVVSDVQLHNADMQRALDSVPRDWGHAPRTIWKIFKYLKYKPRDENVLLGI